MTGAHPPEPPTPTRGRGRPSTLDRPATLDAAWRVIGQRGLDRARYADVAEESGTPVSTLQNAFGTLDALLSEAVTHARSREFVVMLDPPVDERPPRERLHTLVSGSIEAAIAGGSWLSWLELRRSAVRDDTYRDQVVEGYGAWYDAAEAIVADGQRSGDFAADGEPRALAIALVALIDGYLLSLALPVPDVTEDGARAMAIASAERLVGVPRGTSSG